MTGNQGDSELHRCARKQGSLEGGMSAPITTTLQYNLASTSTTVTTRAPEVAFDI